MVALRNEIGGTMDVRLLAYTVITDHVRDRLGNEPGVSDIDLLAEYAGRNCYQSWHKPNPATRENSGYIENIRNHRHWSVLEHGQATFEVEGASLALMWELTRHRHLSFSIRSTRYCPPDGYVLHPTLALFGEHNRSIIDSVESVWDETLAKYHNIFETLRKNGVPLKSCREAAAQFLPVMTSTCIVVSGNMRAWREVIEKRNDPAANAEIQVLAKLVLAELKELAPNTFADMELNPGEKK